MRISPAAKFAHEYVEKAQRPLTEEDLAHAFNSGARYGRSSAWHRIEDSTPECHQDEQIVILLETGRHTYDITIVSGKDYLTFISNRNNCGISIYWAYLRALMVNRVKLPKLKKDETK